jgi:hypothetical protein
MLLSMVTASDSSSRRAEMAAKARDCKLDHAVQIEPGLLLESPENGNISNISRRLSTISR